MEYVSQTSPDGIYFYISSIVHQCIWCNLAISKIADAERVYAKVMNFFIFFPLKLVYVKTASWVLKV